MGNKLVAFCPTDFLEDESFDTIYEVDESNYIGRGKFAEVYLCWRRNAPEKRYALKDINTRLGDMASINRIKEEIHILQVLGNHRALVSLIDKDETAIKIRLVLELCEGGELYDRIQQKQYYPEHEAKVACYNLLEACQYIHNKGIMHRDLKPENILLASKVSNTDIKISDFGLAKISRDYPRRLPRSHSICGSDFYLAPEVIKQEEYGREIDIWAIGVITYVLLSGSLPFFHNVLHKLYRQIVERDLNFPESAWKNVSKGALDFILRLLQVRAGDRLTADQALSHPWLRGTGGGASFSSFDNQSQIGRCGSNNQSQNASYYQHWYGRQPQQGGMPQNAMDMQRAPSQPNTPHPLEHAHKVKQEPQPPQYPPHQAMAVPQHMHQPQSRGAPPPPNNSRRPYGGYPA